MRKPIWPSKPEIRIKAWTEIPYMSWDSLCERLVRLAETHNFTVKWTDVSHFVAQR
jgi:hypothetical protein